MLPPLSPNVPHFTGRIIHNIIGHRDDILLCDVWCDDIVIIVISGGSLSCLYIYDGRRYRAWW